METKQKKFTGFGWFLLLIICLSALHAEKQSTVHIKIMQSVQETIKKSTLEERKILEGAIKVGDEFVTLYYTGQAGYDIEIDEEWNRTFSKLTTITAEKWGEITDNIDGKDIILGCDNLHLIHANIENNGSTILRYETIVLGGWDKFYIKTKKLYSGRKGDIFLLELTLNKESKVTNVNFTYKRDVLNYKLYVEQERRNLSNSITTQKSKENEISIKQKLDSILKASSICRDY
jgi:hypothetical protein